MRTLLRNLTAAGNRQTAKPAPHFCPAPEPQKAGPRPIARQSNPAMKKATREKTAPSGQTGGQSAAARLAPPGPRDAAPGAFRLSRRAARLAKKRREGPSSTHSDAAEFCTGRTALTSLRPSAVPALVRLRHFGAARAFDPPPPQTQATRLLRLGLTAVQQSLCQRSCRTTACGTRLWF